MVSSPRVTPSVVRAWRSCLLVGPALALVFGFTGCGHRRAAMRPIYGTPVPAAMPVLGTPDSSCPAGSTITTVPDASDPFATPAAMAPSAGASGSGVNRAGGGSPPAADVPAEPTLDAPDLKPVNPTSATGTSSGASLTRPSSSRSLGRQSSVSTKRVRVSLRDQVRPFVENPEDLFAPPKADRPWKYVVLHHSANQDGGLDQIDRDHRKLLGFEGCGYHFVIGNGTDSPDGQIEVADRWLNQKNGVHCRNGKNSDINEYGVGICLVGNFDQTAPTPKQVAAAKALVAYLADRYSIVADHQGTHDQFATGPTACPGKNFPTEAILGTRHVAQR